MPHTPKGSEHHRREQGQSLDGPEREKREMRYEGHGTGHAHKAGKKGVERHREHEVHE